MSVYVDDVRWPFGRMIMCHMWADSVDELLNMADKIELPHKWIQKPPKARWIHFDISLSLKKKAIVFGAILTDKYGPLEHLAKIDIKSKDLKLIKHGRNQVKLITKLRKQK